MRIVFFDDFGEYLAMPAFLQARRSFVHGATKDRRALDGSRRCFRGLAPQPLFHSVRAVLILPPVVPPFPANSPLIRIRDGISKEIQALAAFADENAYLLPLRR